MIKASPYVSLFYREWLLDPERTDYHLVFDQSISGVLDLKALEKSLDYFLSQHVLFHSHLIKKLHERTNLTDSYDLYWERNQKTEASNLSLEFYAFLDLERLVSNYLFRPFDLEAGPLYRFCIFSDELKKEHRLFLIMHLVLLDGLSFSEFIKKISEAYSQACSQKNFLCGSLEAQQKSYADLENFLKQKQKNLKKTQPEKFWAEALRDLPEFNNLPYSRPAQSALFAPIPVKSCYFDFEINKFKNYSNYSAHNLFLLTWGLLITRYCHQESSYITYPVSIKEGRSLNFGAHVNTLIMPIRLSSSKNFKALYQESDQFIQSLKLKLNSNLNLKYSDYPTDQILQSVFQETQQTLKLNIGFAQTDLKNTKLEFNFCETKINHDYDIDIGGSELLLEYDLYSQGSGTINFRLRYRADLFQDWQIDSLIDQYQNLLSAVLNNPDEPVVSHVISPAPPWANTRFAPTHSSLAGREKTMPESQKFNILTLFESYAMDPIHSARLALISHQDSQAKSLSYQELNQKSNQLARYIQKKYFNLTRQSLPQEILIPIAAERSLEMIIGILGILKAGGAYVPINPAYPKERIDFILKDTGAVLILVASNKNNKSTFQSKYLKQEFFIYLDQYEPYANESTENLNLPIRPDHLAYVIYTSGTTGQPKGVMVEHHSVINLVKDSGYIDINHQDVFIQLADPVFDAATFEIWGALLNGALLLLPKAGLDFLGDTALFKNYLVQHKVSILWLTKTLFDYFYQADPDLFASLTYLLVGGEALNAHLIQKLCQQDSRPTYLLNGYGPTEATTFSTTYVCQERSPYASHHQIPIGKPFNQIQAYVLDTYLQEVPIGTVGDLYIAGEGLARGYLNQPDLTTEKFISYGQKNQKRLYKTGDLARFLPDGNLEFFGRKDAQVKIRGHRIELSEIELVLTQHSKIKQAVVLAKTQKTNQSEYTYLAAYYVPHNPEDLANPDLSSDLKNYLSSLLPDYMIPSFFILLDQIPVTANGKLNSKLLPEPDFLNAQISQSQSKNPINPIERDVAKIWADILGLPEDQIQSSDHFFRLGGDSILSIQLSSALSRQGYLCQVRDIYKYPELSTLSEYLIASKKYKNIKTQKINTEEGVLEGPLGLLPIQTWFFENLFNKNFKFFNYFNQNFTLIIPEINQENLENNLKKLVQQHDILRCQYLFPGPKDQSGALIKAVYQTEIVIPEIEIFNIKNIKNLTEAMREWQNDFNIFNAASKPLWRVIYLHGYTDGQARLFLAFHHLIIDAVSWRIVLEDLKTLSEGGVLLPKTSSYRQWVSAIHDYGTALLNNNHAELQYWSDLCKEIEKIEKKEIDRSADVPRVQQQGFASVKLTDQLLHQVNLMSQTEANDLLLLALCMALQGIGRGSTHCITLEGHGREDLPTHQALDISRTLGWFTSIYPVKIEVDNNLEKSIYKIKNTLRDIPLKGLGFGALKYHPEAPGHLKNFEMPKISFNYLGQLNTKSYQEPQKTWTLSAELDYQANKEAIHPDNQSPYLIDMIAWVSQGQLFFNINAGIDEYLVEKLAQYFLIFLEKITDHCLKENFKNLENSVIPMTYMQRYFFQYACAEAARFSVVCPFAFTGHLNLDRLEQSIQKIIQTQDVFSLTYQKQETSWIPVINNHDPFQVISEPEPVSLTHLVSRLEHLGQQVNIQTGPILIIYICRLSDLENQKNTYQIICVTHHLYLDRTSFGIFKHQLNYFYKNNFSDEKFPLQTYSFLNWARDLDSYLINQKEREEINSLWGINYKNNTPYSDGFFMDQASVNNHLDDRPENYGTMVFYLDLPFIQEAQKIRHQLPLFNLLFLSLFISSIVLNKDLNPEKNNFIAIDNVFLGRDLQGKIAKESLENTMGWLATNLPVRLDLRELELNFENNLDLIFNLNAQLSRIIQQGNDVLYAAAKNNSDFNLIGKSSALFNYYNRESDDQAELDLMIKEDEFFVSPVHTRLPVMFLEQVDYKFALTVSKNKKDIGFNLYFNRMNYRDQSIINFIECYKKTASYLVHALSALTALESH